MHPDISNDETIRQALGALGIRKSVKRRCFQYLCRYSFTGRGSTNARTMGIFLVSCRRAWPIGGKEELRKANGQKKEYLMYVHDAVHGDL